MTQKPVLPRKKNRPVVPILGIGLLVAVLLAVGGFGFAASQESHDGFCASCHTQPESTFFQRSTTRTPVDLASFHTTKSTRCIDCHSGQGIIGRMTAELIGARNAFKWYTGTAVQPAVLTFAIGDQNCLKCHQNVTQQGFTPIEQITVPGATTTREGEREGRNNHWHEFLVRWQAASPTAGSCVSCHSGHTMGSAAQNGFMNAQDVESTCNACHQVLREREG
ncbi:MAG: NapC/NirT family cytochrome c [Chloroflexi bacterium]|nr:NapC/NirT family cytochrome c [Chloroflexota bacterium]